MCEANVYLNRSGNEELLMERVDRIIPGENNLIVLESIFGERKMVKARIREMELVHHRIILEEIAAAAAVKDYEIWFDLDNDHGHFHAGDDVRFKLFKGYNMQPVAEAEFHELRAYVAKKGRTIPVELHSHHGNFEVNLGQEADGLVTLYAHDRGEKELYCKITAEIGHHHHHGLEPIGLPLEIVPLNFSHVHLGDNYEIQVLKDGEPLAGVEVRATYAKSKNREYPFRLTTDKEGRARVMLTARGNWLFSVVHENIISTFTLVKSF